jgi:hypothetical protein
MKKYTRSFYVLILLNALSLLTGTMVSGQIQNETVNGIVFEDINKNLQHDAGEKGIPGILVSNQNDIVETDKDGRYLLSVDQEETIIFIVKPAGYLLPMDENNLPQFYYIHKPKGSPDLKYPGIPPTVTLPEKLNFPLFPAEIKDTFDVIILADPQPLVPEDLNYLRDDIVTELAGIKASFGIVLGDVVWDNLSLYDHYTGIMSVLHKPFYYAPGNHDFNYNPTTNQHTLETFNRVFGPGYYAFEYGQISFIVLNSVYWNENKSDKPWDRYIGKIDEKQLRWLDNYIQHVPEEKLIVLCMHIPILSFAEQGDASNVTNREKIFELVKDRKYLLNINGHLHKTENFFLDEHAGWTSEFPFHLITCTTASGALWRGPEDVRGIPVAYQSDGTPNGYHIFHFYGNAYSQCYKAASEDDRYQIRISSPSGIIGKNELDSMPVTANFFNGNEKSTVTCRIDNEKPAAMLRCLMKDPFMVKHMAEYPGSYYEWERPAESIHIWTVKLPANLEAGIHKIVVSATDEYGNEYEEIAIFEVE